MRHNTALVMGLGVSGCAAARLLNSKGVAVTVIDSGGSDRLQAKGMELTGEGINVVPGACAVPAGKYDLCVVSPGIAADSDWVNTVRDKGIQVVSELELGSRHCECPLIAVTGSNGKSTMVKLCGEVFEKAGKRVRVAGNYGFPLCAAADESRELDYIVVEVSSFQLELVQDFHPATGVLLNIQPDHLDRHGDLRNYTAVKLRMFENMQADDLGLVAADMVRPALDLARGANRWLSFGTTSASDYRYEPGRVIWTRGPDEFELDVGATMFDNEILGCTAAAALGVARECGVSARCVQETLRSFKPLPHRMAPVGEKHGVSFINDSKATNLAALGAALRMCRKPVRLIAGGRLKENDLDSIKELLVNRVRSVYLMGEASERMFDAWHNVVDCKRCGDLERATRAAARDAAEGEAVLLSPGCASFDQFGNFEERGKEFIKTVRLINEEK